jgi:hypothetical protein
MPSDNAGPQAGTLTALFNAFKDNRELADAYVVLLQDAVAGNKESQGFLVLLGAAYAAGKADALKGN